MKRLMLVLCAAVLAGCVTEDGRREAPPQPTAALPVDKIIATTGFPDDSDGNGYPDQFLVTISLWSDQSIAWSVEAAGEIEVNLVRTGTDKKLASWKYDAQALKEMCRKLQTGPGYIMRVSLLDQTSDRMPRTSVDLRVIYTPADGKRVLGNAGTVPIGTKG